MIFILLIALSLLIIAIFITENENNSKINSDKPLFIRKELQCLEIRKPELLKSRYNQFLNHCQFLVSEYNDIEKKKVKRNGTCSKCGSIKFINLSDYGSKDINKIKCVNCGNEIYKYSREYYDVDKIIEYAIISLEILLFRYSNIMEVDFDENDVEEIYDNIEAKRKGELDLYIKKHTYHRNTIKKVFDGCDFDVLIYLMNKFYKDENRILVTPKSMENFIKYGEEIIVEELNIKE